MNAVNGQSNCVYKGMSTIQLCLQCLSFDLRYPVICLLLDGLAIGNDHGILHVLIMAHMLGQLELELLVSARKEVLHGLHLANVS